MSLPDVVLPLILSQAYGRKEIKEESGFSRLVELAMSDYRKPPFLSTPDIVNTVSTQRTSFGVTQISALRYRLRTTVPSTIIQSVLWYVPFWHNIHFEQFERVLSFCIA